MSIKIQTIVVEDEPLAREGLLNYIKDVDFLEVKSVCEDALEAEPCAGRLESIDSYVPGCTDAQDHRHRLSEVAQESTHGDHDHAYPNFALQGFMNWMYLIYLVKPFPFDRFLKLRTKRGITLS